MQGVRGSKQLHERNIEQRKENPYYRVATFDNDPEVTFRSVGPMMAERRQNMLRHSDVVNLWVTLLL